MSTPSDGIVGVILMTYGSATTAERVRPYLERIYKDKASDTLIADFENRYRLIGHSPLIEMTEHQALDLQTELGNGFVVRAGMRHSAPSIDEAVASCKASGATSLVGIILSPQFSSFIMEGYKIAFATAAQNQGIAHAVVVDPWPAEEHFIELLATRTQQALDTIKKETGTDAPVIFTTHSMPKRVVENDPSYMEQLSATIDAVRRRLDPTIKWHAAYQSAGHSPGEWLKPDLMDILAELRDKKTASVLIVPIQFLSDHLEVLYDLDIAARKQCEMLGINYHRIQLPNRDPLFIQSLANTARHSKPLAE